MDYEKEYYDNLVGQESTNRTFSKIEERFSKYGEEISKIKFLYRNVQYNKFRFLEEFNRGDGWQIDKEGLKKINAKSFKLQLPFTLWSDILFFELNSFFTNVIRTINFILELKLKRFDEYNIKRQISIGKFMQDRTYSNTILYSFFQIEWNNWIEKVNNLRNKVVHQNIVTKTGGIFNVSAKIVNDKIIKNEQKTLSINEYNIKDLEHFVNETNNNLGKLITNFFQKLEK